MSNKNTFVTDEALMKIIDALGLKEGMKNNWANVQRVVQAGLAPMLFSIGEQFIVPYTIGTKVYEMPFDIVHFGKAIVIENDEEIEKPAIYLQQHYATVEDVIYDAPEPTNMNANIQVFGYGRWSQSSIRQWLNSDASAGNWWTAQSDTDDAPSDLDSRSGYLDRLNKDFQSVLATTKIMTAYNTETNGRATDVTWDKIFLPSVEQMYGYSQFAGIEGECWEYWKQVTGMSEPSNSGGKRIQYGIDKPSGQWGAYCWLRSTTNYAPHSVQILNTSGYITSSSPSTRNRCAPACVIC